MKTIFDNNYSEKDDKKLIVEAKGGSKTALEQLIKRHYNFIYNIAIRFVLSPVDAQDLTQEVLIKIITKLSSYTNKSSFRTWLYRITFNHFLNSKRNKMEQVIISFDEYGNALNNIQSEELTAQEQIDYNEKIEDAKIGCMTGMLLCLDRKQRLVYILGEMFEIKSVIGAELLDISSENFRKILSRARKDLYNFMNNKCGLVNLNNPCRCPKKTKGFIKEGWVNVADLQFNNHFINKISEISIEKSNACDTIMEEKYGKLFKEHPYYDKDKSNEIVSGLMEDKELQQIYNL